MNKLILILALVLVLILLGILAVLVLHERESQSQPQVYCSFPQPQFAEYGCTVNQNMPVYHPQPGEPDAPGDFIPLYPGSSICRVYYVDGLQNGTLTFCPAASR